MAIIKTKNGKGNYKNENAKELVLNYILNPYKTPHNYIGGVAVDMTSPAESMMYVSKQFKKENGVQLRHFILSFSPEELTNPEIAYCIGLKVVRELGKEYQAVFAVHENAVNIHIHIICNSVSYIDGRRYYGTRKEFCEFKRNLDRILNRYNLPKSYYMSNYN